MMNNKIIYHMKAKNFKIDVESITTKFGTAKISNWGYWKITSGKEGNFGKLLHRLMFEDYHDCKLDKNDIIHHIDGDALNNHPTNLICISKKAHTLLHHRGRKHSDETKQKISESHKGKKLSEHHKQKISEGLKGVLRSEGTKQRISESLTGVSKTNEHIENRSKSTNTTGYFRVSKIKCKNCKQDFIYQYTYTEDGKRHTISSVDIRKLESKVKARGLKWLKFEGGG